jgi:alginate O-acetyltransferase complex protein AlgI
MQNFAFPYFSRDIAEFWRRWHISLSTWFRDYVYIPIGGSRVSRLKQIRNVFVIFLVSGFWHGANYTFIAWGTAHALLFVPLLLSNRNRRFTQYIDRWELLKKPQIFLNILFTFTMVTVAWIFFRAQSIGDALAYIGKMVETIFQPPVKHIHIERQPVFYAIIFMLVIEWINRTEKHGLQIKYWPVIVRWLLYVFIGLVIFMYGRFEQTEFIYFAF